MPSKGGAVNIVIAAGGTGGHIFPALAAVQEWRRQDPAVRVWWVGTARSRERDLCEQHAIDLTVLSVTGMPRTPGVRMARSLGAFAGALGEVRRLFATFCPDAVLAFGGYVCGPVLTMARLAAIPYVLHEQNTVPGMVNKLFASRAAAVFLGFPVDTRYRLRGKTFVTGNPVRRISGTYRDFPYPQRFDRDRTTVLVCGGSQGAVSMNRLLLDAARGWADSGIQVVWQTGESGYEEVRAAFEAVANVFIFPSMPDLYPWYAAARVVVGRAGASTISEAGYFGLPCVLIPLPWATGNHQYYNAGLVEGQGWGQRVCQDEACARTTDHWVRRIVDDGELFEAMSRRALDHSPAAAAAAIVTRTRELLESGAP